MPSFVVNNLAIHPKKESSSHVKNLKASTNLKLIKNYNELPYTLCCTLTAQRT